MFRAKEIFFSFYCHPMPDREREKEYKEYKLYNVSNEQEREWTHEFVSHWISRLSVDDFQAVNNLSAVCVKEALPEMYRISELGDSLTKLWYANAIWKIASGGIMSPIMRERARRKAVFLWQSLVDNPIEFTDEHRKKVLEMVENQAKIEKSIQTAKESRGIHPSAITSQRATPNDYILNYAKSKLRESKKRNGFHFLLTSLFMGFISLIGVVIDLIDKIKRFSKG